MTLSSHDPERFWTVAEAKARLSELLRLASNEGPQRIGQRKRYVVVSEEEWEKHTRPRLPLGRWLVQRVPRGEELTLPDRTDPPRVAPFEDSEER